MSALQDNHSQSDRLLRSAVSAYCALTRPGKKEAEQLQDLALPLIDTANVEALRFVATALSACEVEPEELVLALAQMPIEIAAPLLARAHSLRDIDLLNIISQHGVSHARVIGSRDDLSAPIRHLTEIVEARGWRPEHLEAQAAPDESEMVQETRERLRTIMRATSDDAAHANVDVDFIYEDLRESALAGSADQVAAALANALGVNVAIARTIAGDASLAQLTPALRALNLSEEEAFLVCASVHPTHFRSADAIRAFLRFYRSMQFEEIEFQLTRWQDAGAAPAAAQVLLSSRQSA